MGRSIRAADRVGKCRRGERPTQPGFASSTSPCWGGETVLDIASDARKSSSMSDLPTAEDEYRAADRRAYFEQRLFVLSPFSAFVTTLILFTVLFGTFLIAAEAEHVRLYSESPHGLIVESGLRMAFTLSLMLCGVLFVQRYTRMKERTDRAAFAGRAEARRAGAAQSGAADAQRGAPAAVHDHRRRHRPGRELGGVRRRPAVGRPSALCHRHLVRGHQYAVDHVVHARGRTVAHRQPRHRRRPSTTT